MTNKVKILTMLLAALLAVGLLLATACTNPTNGEPGAPGAPGKDGTPGKDGSDGTGIDGEDGAAGGPGGTGPASNAGIVTLGPGQGPFTGSQLTGILNRSDVTTVIMAGATLDSSPGTVEVKSGKTLAVIGDLDLVAGHIYTINAYNGTLDLTDGRLINTTGDILMLNADNKKYAEDNNKIDGTPEYVAVITLSDITTLTTAGGSAMIEGLAIGTGPNTVAADTLKDYMNGDQLYINGPLTTNVADPFLTTTVTVYGETTAAADITLTAAADLRGGLKAGAATVAVTGLENFTGTLNTNGNTFTSNAATVILAELGGTGHLGLTEATGSVTITGGTGNVEFGNAAVTLSTAKFGNFGTVTFTEDATISDATGSFTGSAVFEGAAILSGAVIAFNDTAAFEGAATLSGTTITFADTAAFEDDVTTTAAATFSGDATFTAAAPKTVAIGGATTFEGIASFGANVTVTPSAAVAVIFEGEAGFAEDLATGSAIVTFKGESTFAALTTDSGAVTFENTSTAEFTGPVTTGGAVNFNGLTTTFADDLTITAVGVSFGGDAFFVDDHEISGDYAFTLVNSKSLGVINGSSQIPILTGGVGNATITPSSSGVLAFTDDGKITQSAGAILIGGAALLADDASYEVTQNLSLTLNAGGSLTLDGPDAALILDNDGSDAAALKGTGELIAGGAKIVGGTNGWTADNANSSPLTVIISPDSIRGSTADAILAGADSSSAITVAAAGNLALVENIKIDLSTAGTITITQTGLITLGPDSSIIGVGTSVGTGNSTSITNIISGANIVYTSNAGDVLETITTTDGTTGNTLTADGGNATIDKTTTVS